jgi:hypothetical protein
MKHPIKVNILNKNGEISIKYIFIGSDDPDIQRILSKKLILNRANIDILKKKYGIKWRKILCIDEYMGGNDIDDSEEGPYVTIEDIYSITNILDKPQEIIATPQTANNAKINYIFQNINSFDNILEFKKKIAVITRIPIYKQNIYYSHNKKVYNLNYNIFLQNSIVHISILNNIINNKAVELINDIPILINFYNVKNLIKIKAYDPFSVIDNFTTNLGIQEFNLFNIDDFVPKDNISLKSDKNQLEIIYYGFVMLFWPMISFPAWMDYTGNSITNFEKMYPDIAPNINDINMFKLEDQITNNATELFYNKKKRSAIEKDMFISITDATIEVKSPYNQNIVNLRNLFDLIKLDNQIISCKCAVSYNKKSIYLNKAFMNNDQITIAIPNKCLMIKFAIDKWTAMQLFIYTNGRYIIRSKWSEDKLYGFSDIFDIVSITINKIITYINTMGSTVISSNYQLEQMSIKNSKFSEIYVSLIYRNPIKFYEFKIIENILKEYMDAGIVRSHDINTETNVMQYYFSKGMYKFNEEKIEHTIVLNNYYNFLTNYIVKNKWVQLFQQTRNTTFQYRHGDIKISVEGIKEKEFDIFYMYIINIFDMLEMQKKTYIPKTVTQFKLKKNVKTLKYQDPLLYDFKRLYNSTMVYSRLCQKKNQPIILNDDEYDSLSETKKKEIVTYWNFTTKSPAYYQCPNPKYPHLQFTVNKHPKDYCIPCCKIKPVDPNSENNTKELIYNTCLEKHVYTDAKVNLDTKYIMSYGKFITPGRICNLPEETIEPLLYESFSEISGLEPKCKNKYYIYGIEQNIKYITNVGYITLLAFTLDMSVSELMEQTVVFLKKMPVYFKTIMDGKIIKYFKTITYLIDAIENNFISDNILTSNKKVPWNLIFIDIAYYYFNIISVIFDDLSTTHEYIKLQLTNKITNATTDKNYKSLFMIKKNKMYNPIYNINSSIYFKTKIINKKLFSSDDILLDILTKISEFSAADMEAGHESPNLEILKKFISVSKYKITKYFVNSHNLCYYTEITHNNNNKIFVPVAFSIHIADTTESIIEYKPFKIAQNNTPFKYLNAFIKDFNHWIATISELNLTKEKTLPLEQRVIPVYKYIMANKWIYLNNPWSGKKNTLAADEEKNIIGFICNGINFYHEPLSYKFVKTISKAPLERILYHPDIVNENLTSKTTIVDPRAKNITKNIYKYHLYELLLLEFIELLNKEKNKEIRHLIKKQILKRTDANAEEVIATINTILDDYYKRYPDENNSDSDILIEQINDYAINHRDKKLLLAQIDAMTYNFDKIMINSFKEMPKKQLITALTKISKQIVTIVYEKNVNKILSEITEFPNMFISCQNQFSEMVYCKQNKLIITKENLEILLEIMASDILNKFKSHYIFNQLFTDNIISYLKFIRRPHEYIEIHARQ